MEKRANTIQDLLRQTFDGKDSDFAKTTEAYIEKRRLGKILAIMREHASMSQKDVALKCGWTQSKVSKLESQIDDDFGIKEMRSYLQAVGMSMEVMFMPHSATIADRVRFYFLRMFDSLKKISSLAKGDQKIQDGVNSFMMEATSNILKASHFCLSSIKEKHRSIPEETIEIVEPEFMRSPNLARDKMFA